MHNKYTNSEYNNILEKELKKYKKLYELKIEQNFCQKQLAELKEKLQTSRDEWDDLTRQDLNHEMDCLLEYLSVEEQKEKTLKYEIEEKVLSEQIKGSTMILTKWRGYTTTIKKRTPFYCKIELYNSEDNHFIMV